MPTDLGGLNIEVSEDQMKELALKCSHFGKRTIGCVKKLNQEDIYRIYQKAADRTITFKDCFTKKGWHKSVIGDTIRKICSS